VPWHEGGSKLASGNDFPIAPHLSKSPNVAIAEANREELERRYQQLTSEATTGSSQKRLNEFVAHVRTAKRVSINLSAQSLLKFLQTGEYLNIHELISRGMRKQETVFYYQSRCSIEEALGYTEEVRRHIYYGALNTGNLGAINYGLCCIVLKSTSEIQHRLSFLKQNSLSYRKDESPKLKQDVALWENVHQLAAQKHQDAIKGRESPWGGEDINLLVLFYSATLRLSDFIEAHLWGKITPADVSEVRFPRADFDWVMECLANLTLSSRLASGEKKRVRSMAKVIQTVQELNIPITRM
jgi:hypothetical protein